MEEKGNKGGEYGSCSGDRPSAMILLFHYPPCWSSGIVLLGYVAMLVQQPPDIHAKFDTRVKGYMSHNS
jgi:hypothetical protein